MSSKDVEAVGDIVNGTNYTSGSAADEYYKFKLLKEKLQLARPGGAGEGSISAAGMKILKAQSEKDEIELQILEKLTSITESSPEFAQVVDITGTKDRYEQAKRLAETVYDRVRSEKILQFYTPSKDQLLSHFKERTLASSGNRLEVLNSITGVAATSPAAAVASALTGGGGGRASRGDS